MSERRKPLRWRKVSVRAFARRETRYELWRGAEEIVVAQSTGGNRWYFYSRSPRLPYVNTCNAPFASLADMKAEAMRWAREHGA